MNASGLFCFGVTEKPSSGRIRVTASLLRGDITNSFHRGLVIHCFLARFMFRLLSFDVIVKRNHEAVAFCNHVDVYLTTVKR